MIDYMELLKQMLPDCKFNIVNFSESRMARYCTIEIHRQFEDGKGYPVARYRKDFDLKDTITSDEALNQVAEIAMTLLLNDSVKSEVRDVVGIRNPTIAMYDKGLGVAVDKDSDCAVIPNNHPLEEN